MSKDAVMRKIAEDASRRNEATIRSWYRALEEADYDAALALVTNDVVVHVGGHSRLAGEYRGTEGLISIAGVIGQLTRGTHRTQLLDVMVNNRFAVARHRWTATRDDGTIEMVNLILFRLVDGRIAERWEFIDDERAHDAFWSWRHENRARTADRCASQTSATIASCPTVGAA
jgi:ketosteroid isomerase-like protein